MGEIWPKIAHSMIGRLRMDNLQMCMDTVLKDNIEGDFIETGVWRGGVASLHVGSLRFTELTIGKCGWQIRFKEYPPQMK